MQEHNPYAPPRADVAAPMARPAPAAAPALWNPNAAASWSLLLSPVFGALLHMKNWQALGEPGKAEASRRWAIGCGAFLLAWTLLSMVWPDSKPLDLASRLGAFVLLIAWYYASGKPQQAYVVAKYGPGYPRRGWGKPLGIAVGVFLAFMAIVFVLALVVGLVAGRG